jgi:hypothetical protein
MARVLRLLPLGLLVLLGSCGRSDSPQTQIRRAIDAMETAAESRDVGDVLAFVSTEFRDQYGEGRDELSRYLRAYFIANQSLHLLTRINSIELPAADEARVKVTVGTVSREADATAAWNLAVDVHDFDVTMRKEGQEWNVTFVKWQRH